MKRQRGLTTLLVTTMLLVVSLIFSLASYKNLFYQIKRTQNEVMARKAHWLAEGGLECAFTELKVSGLLPSDPAYLNTCDSEIDNTSLDITVHGSQINIKALTQTSVGAKANVRKVAQYAGGVNSTIKMNASILELTGSQHFIPNPTNKLSGSNDYACQSVVSSGEVKYIGSGGTDDHFITIDSTRSSHGGGPHGAVGFTCDSNYLSNIFDLSNVPTGFTASDYAKGSDILEGVNVNVFRDIFGVEYSDWKSVRESIANEVKGDVIGPEVVNGKGGDDITTQGWVKNCSDLVKSSYDKGNKKIWVDGSCVLGANIFGGVVSDNSILLVINNGFLEFNAAGAFNGLLYQYASPTLDAKKIWEDRIDNIPTPAKAFNKVDIDPNYLNVSFYIFGSTYFDGAIGVDSPGRTVRINGSIIPSYNADKSSKYISGHLQWQEGSWHDF